VPKLSYQEFSDVLKKGGSVLYEGQVISNVSQLPSRADMTKGDKAREESTRQYYDDQIAQLSRERAKLNDSHPERPATGTETADKGALVNDPPLVQETPEMMKERREAAGLHGDEPAKQAHRKDH